MTQGTGKFPTEVFLEELEYMVNIDSGPDCPEGCHLIASFLLQKLLAIGYEAEIISYGKENRPLLKAHSPGKQASYDYLLIGHLDTVFPKGTTACRPFAVKDGKAYGPGTVDMKAGVLLMIYIAEALLTTRPDLSLCLMFNSDEETGSMESAPYLLDAARQCRCAFVFEGGRKNEQFVYERKGCVKYDINVTGIPSHAGTAPHLGASAIVEMAHWIELLDRLKRYDRGTSVNIGLIEGGSALNVVAEHCIAKVEIRYSEEKELTRVEQAMKKRQAKPYVAGTQTSVTRLSHTSPLTATRKTLQLMEIIRSYGVQISQNPPVDFVKAGGLSDANRLAQAEIPIVDGCGPGGGFPHSEKEFLLIETVEKRFYFMTGLLQYLGNSDCLR